MKKETGHETIEYLIKTFNDSNLSELEYTSQAFSLKLGKSAKAQQFTQQTAQAPQESNSVNEIPNSIQSTPQSVAKKEIFITSPMVGKFYLKPKPSEPDFIKVGDSITVGQVIAIIEAMKVMNQIRAEKAGIVKKIFVEPGDPVEYGQNLILIEP